jgi:hypothetical protein
MLAGQGSAVNNGSRIGKPIRLSSRAKRGTLGFGQSAVAAPSRLSLCHRNRTTLRKAYFNERVRLAPRRRKPCHPILAVHRLVRLCMFLSREKPRNRLNLFPRNFSAHRAWSHRHLRIVADALHLARIAARHHIEMVALFAEPNRRRDLVPILAERSQRNIFLSANCPRNLRSHIAIVAIEHKISRILAIRQPNRRASDTDVLFREPSALGG